MGDNSVDMIPPALDNGEPNSTMANQIAYSQKETILEEGTGRQRSGKGAIYRRVVVVRVYKCCHHHSKLNGVR